MKNVILLIPVAIMLMMLTSHDSTGAINILQNYTDNDVENYLNESVLVANVPAETVNYNGDGEVVTNQSGNGEGENVMGNINITVGDSVFSAKLYDNSSAKAFLAQLPMTLNMSDLNNNEKYYYLPEDLPSDLTERPETIKNGDIMCWSGNCLVLFYKTFSNSYGGYARLGYVEDPTGFAAVLESGNVRVEFAISKIHTQT